MQQIRKFQSCQYCGIYYQITKVDIHEATCAVNPVSPRRIHSGGRQYVERSAIHTNSAPPIRISIIQFKWGDKEPIMRDQAFRLLKAGLLKRPNRGTFDCFSPIANISSDQMDLLWSEIERAKRMGARI